MMDRLSQFIRIAFLNEQPVISRDQEKIVESSKLNIKQREIEKRYRQGLDNLDALFAAVINEKGNGHGD